MSNQAALSSFREEVRNWLSANCPESMRKPMKNSSDYYWGGRNGKFQSEDQRLWFEAMKERNWVVPYWPKEYGGGGLSKEENSILQQEMKRLGCRKPIVSFGVSMLGPALLKFGNEEQKNEHLPKITSGDIRWCQGYSEPNAGSDLANLQTKAVDMGDYFLVTGQKVWTSYANKADWMFCLVRTNSDVKKQAGISFVLIDMQSEGVSTQPIQLISGASPFCETFLDNVKVPKSNLVGTLNNGWTIAKYLLTHEREMISSMGDAQIEEPLYETAVKSLGKENGQLSDTSIRKDITDWSIDKLAFDLTLKRAGDETKAGHSLGAKASFLKYYGTELNKARHELIMKIQGYDGLEWEGENEGRIARNFLRTKGNSIEGGTSEIQLNIIAGALLGLPRK